MRRSTAPKPLYWVGVLLFVLGVSSLVGMLVWRTLEKKHTEELINQKARSFVLYNEIDPSERVKQNKLLEYTEDVIQAVTEDQKVTTKDNTILLTIPDLDIEAPILEGVDTGTLSIAAGHFPDTGTIGKGNYCIAGHSSAAYDCIFNNLKDVKLGMRMNLIDTEGVCYTYFVTENKVVEPRDTWVLDDYKDNRLTIVTCTDGGLRRQIVIGLLMSDEEYAEYCRRTEVSKRMDIVEQSKRYSDIRIAEYLEEVSTK